MLSTNYRDWIEIAYRRRRTALIAGLTVFGVVAVGTLLWPPVYLSNCQVLVQDIGRKSLASPDLQGSSSKIPPQSAIQSANRISIPNAN